MDNNEQIVRIWLETQGFLVLSRLKYKVNREKSSGWSDVDLVAYRPSDNKRVVVDVTAWMVEKITVSYIRNPKSGTYKRLININSPEARTAIQTAFGVQSDDDYDIWHVVSFISNKQREKVLAECGKYVNRVIEFPEIMTDLVEFVRDKPNPTQETETLHTIRALVLCGLLKQYNTRLNTL